MSGPIVQHLIDPELCIRCNTCEETCPQQAISNDFRNYVVDVAICNGCKACVSPCPTGAINNWRLVEAGEAYSLQQQFDWDALPPQQGNEAGADEPGPPYPERTPALGRVVENRRLTRAVSGGDVHHIVVDVSGQDFPFLEGQSVGVIPPGLTAEGAPQRMRLYSVACSRTGEQGRAGVLALTVKRVVDEDGQGKAPGVCSNYLCDSRPGDELRLTGPFGADFLMPEDAAAGLLMICTGTGVAPMRAMMARAREAGGGRGGMLIYGGRSPVEMAYHDALASPRAGMEQGGVGIHFGYSRVSGQPRRYVQDVVQEQGAAVLALLDDGRSHVYVCGLKGMEQGVLQAFAAVCREHGRDWPVMEASLRSGGRLHVETY